MLMSRLYSSFQTLDYGVNVVSRCAQKASEMFLLCGDAIWTAVVARINGKKYGYWDAKGEAIFPQHEHLKVIGGTDELTKMIHTKPTVEDYSTRGLQLPERLMGEHVRLTPDNFVLDDVVYDTVLAEAVNDEKKWLGVSLMTRQSSPRLMILALALKRMRTQSSFYT